MVKLVQMFFAIGLGIIAVYFVIALALIYWPADVFKNAPKITAEQFRAGQIASGVDYDQPNTFTERQFVMRDGANLYARVFDAPAATMTILLIHGVASHSTPFNRPAGLIREATGARIVTIDLRGHGKSSGKPWNVAYIGQYDNDVSDVIAALRKDNPNGKIILAGHSMGGGIALRHALKAGAPAVDAYLLVAPLLGGNSPTMPSGGGAAGGAPPATPYAADQFVYFRTPRLFGVLGLNIAGISALNQLPILYFNQPPKMPAYGFSALASMQPSAPKDYRVALGAIHVPLLLIAGEKDEAFHAEAYKGVIAQYSKGEAVIVSGATHNGVLESAAAIDAIKTWAARL